MGASAQAGQTRKRGDASMTNNTGGSDDAGQVTERRSWSIRWAGPGDEAFLERLAPRLAIGIAPWRSAEAMTATARRWLLDDLERARHGGAMVFIAQTDTSVPIGAVAVAPGQHFTGTLEATIGELAVLEEWEGQGVGAALIAAAEAWAREHGASRISLATGVANSRALTFYARHGYQQEDVRLSKPLSE
jgi:GNAT superfamily N-acetyltransferase